MHTVSSEIEVAAAVIQKKAGSSSRMTLAMRRSGGSMQGYWEFPGGKRESGESMQECLIREIQEELGLVIVVGDLLAVNTHQAGTLTIKLHAFIVTQWTGNILMVDHDEMKWLEDKDLGSLKWSPADIPLVEMLGSENINAG